MRQTKTLGTRVMKRIFIGTAMLCLLQMPAEPRRATQKKPAISAYGTIDGIELAWLRIFRDPFPNMQVDYSVKTGLKGKK